MDFIENDRLVVGGIYPVNCRNFSLGIFVNKAGGSDAARLGVFTGVRQKFGFKYITNELGMAIDWPIGKDEIVALAEYLQGIEITQSEQYTRERAEDEADDEVDS